MQSSERQILRTSSIIGAASLLNIVFGLIRVKVAALLLGPAGVGLIGLFQNLLQTAVTFGSVGLGAAGTRQIAEAAAGGSEAPAIARRALFVTAVLLALVSSSLFYVLRHTLATTLFDDLSLAGPIGLLSLGIALSLAMAYQTAVLTGLQQIGDIARISVISSLTTTVVASILLYYLRKDALVLFVLATPAASAVAGAYYVSRLHRPSGSFFRGWEGLLGAMAVLIRGGTALTLAGLAMLLAQFAMRTMIQRQLGPAALGLFQAAWFISITYIGFILQAMGTDYYPRLTAAIQDHDAVNRMVNEQTEVALYLAAPVLLGILALTPWVVQLLYSKDFMGAVTLLRWQILGDILKVASWPMSFILLATGDTRTYLLTETIGAAVLLCVAALLLPIVGLGASGIAVFVMYLVYLPLVYRLARQRTAMRWSLAVTRLFCSLFAVSTLVFAIAIWSAQGGAIIGCIFAAAFATVALRRYAPSLPGPFRRSRASPSKNQDTP